jgi:hypothetical protein
MIYSSEKRFFTSNLPVVENWTPNRRATQSRGDVGGAGKILSAQARRNAVVAVRANTQLSERRTCRLLGLSRSVQRAALPVPAEG